MSEAQSDMPEMTQEQLPKILEGVVTKSADKFKKLCRDRAKKYVLQKTETKKKGKKTTNPVLLERKISFRLPENCNAESFRDIDEVKSKLVDWKLQSRVRATTMRDTYYSHIGSTRTLRSIREVVNYILPESYPKLPSRKRAKCGEDVDETMEDSNENSQEVEAAEGKEEENLELQKVSKETLQQAQPEDSNENSKDIEEENKEENLELQKVLAETLQQAPLYSNENSQDIEEENKDENLELQNVSEETLMQQAPSKAEASIEIGGETSDKLVNNDMEKDGPHDAAMDDVTEDSPHDEVMEDVAKYQPDEEVVNVMAEEHPHDEVVNVVAKDFPHDEEAMIDAVEDHPHEEGAMNVVEAEDRPHDEAANDVVVEDGPVEAAMNVVDAAEDHPSDEAMNDGIAEEAGPVEDPVNENVDVGAQNDHDEDEGKLEEISIDFSAYSDLWVNYITRL